MIVRTDRNAQDLAPVLEQTVCGLDPGLPVTIKPWERELGAALVPARAASIALGVLGELGAMLSTTGIFGMAAYSVSKRLRELGIRVPLGAQSREVLTAALGRAFRVLAFGSTEGVFLGILASRLLAFIVYQASPRDPLLLMEAVMTMLLLGIVATWIPARRALSIDPVSLLREE